MIGMAKECGDSCIQRYDMEREMLTCCFAFAVVTLDGVLLAKSGTMTGGQSGGMESRSQKWDNQAVEGAVVVVVQLGGVVISRAFSLGLQLMRQCG